MPIGLIIVFFAMVVAGIVCISKRANASGGALLGASMALIVGWRSASLKFASMLPASAERTAAAEMDTEILAAFSVALAGIVIIMTILDLRARRDAQ